MGWWKLLTNANNAEGIREAMRMSYKKHLNGAYSGQGPVDGTPEHHVGLYGALASRYRLGGVSTTEFLIWSTLAPFLAMSSTESVEALAEYVVLLERPGEAKKAWLSSAVNRALRNATDKRIRFMARFGLANQLGWCELLERDVQESLQQSTSQVLDDFGQGDDA